MIRRLADAMRDAANVLDPAPPRPSPKVEITVTRSRRKVIDGVEWLPDAADHEPMVPPLEAAQMGMYDTLDLRHDVHAWDQEGRPSTVEHTYHVSWREVQL